MTSALTNAIRVVDFFGMADAASYTQIPEAATTSDERTMATLAHVLQLCGGFIAPLIIFLIKRDSRFVSFHALQALLLQGLYFVLMMVLVAAVMASFVAAGVFHQSSDQHQTLPPVFLFLFPILWLGMMGWWVFMLVVAIVYGIKAGRGEWSGYPIIGQFARKILNIDCSGGIAVP